MSGEGIHNPSDLTDVEVDLAAITAALVVIDNEIANLDADLVLVQNDVTDIMAVTDALPTLTTMSGESTTTVINTEYDLYINNAPVGVYRPIVVTVNFLNQTAAETVMIREYRRDVPAGVWTRFDELEYAGVHDAIIIHLEPNRYGMRTTIERTAGAARAYPWSAFYEI